ncbi:uncharacterized protein LOC125491990 [Beta vulgaris subsp. vulgaris]|uniref:uncharacterized protein LOC125491990 n=1 Tax=Beta vulgaris subsp. vulgaris TaxID=3555 RepID=UPI00203733DE|nr:uncharacterized protein LOC125491990 [Beta vulgaris subsp. vulgaris]
MDNEKPKKPSYAFNSLFKACTSFKKRLYKKIGNGRNINLQQDRWSASLDLQPLVRHNQHLEDHPTVVADLIDERKNWRVNKIWTYFSPEKARSILALHIPKDDTEDSMDWSHTKSGNYSVKSGYWFLKSVQNNPDSNPTFWRMLWKSNIFPKWKHFIWKIMVKALPTTDNLIKRKIPNISPTCKLCNSRNENTTHILRDCQISQRVWFITMGISTSNSTQIPIQDWIKNFLNFFRKKKEDGERMIISFISTLWSIWLHRNEIIFKGTTSNPERIVELEKENSRRANNSEQRRNNENQLSKKSFSRENDEDSAVSWSKGSQTTNPNQVIVVDGAWKKKKNKSQWQAAIAWKNISQVSGEAYANRIFATSPLQTEAYAILQATKYMEWKCSDIIIKTDNLEVVKALQQNEKADKSISSIILEIKQRANSFQYFSCIKVKREEVFLAHNLAKMARLGIPSSTII